MALCMPPSTCAFIISSKLPLHLVILLLLHLSPHLLLLICSYILLPHYGGSFNTFSLFLPQICIAFIIRKKLRKIEVTSIEHLLYVRHPSKIYMLIHLILSIPVR